MKSSIHNLSQICDEILAAENQDLVEVASERISIRMKRENIEKKELTGQDVSEQIEKGAASADGACEEHNSESESEEEMQAQSFDKVITSEHTRRRKSVTRAQPSTTSASTAILKKKRVINNFESSSNKRQKRFMIADVEKFKRKNISVFFK